MMMRGLLVDGHAHATASVLPEAVARLPIIVHQDSPERCMFFCVAPIAGDVPRLLNMRTGAGRK
jgi:hypothetical protein